MTHRDRVRVFDRWVTIDHPGRPDDHAVVDEVLCGNVYRVEPGQVYQKIVVDCGANIGCFTSLALTCSPRMLLAIEPDPTNRVWLAKNIAQNVGDALVTVSPYAIGDPSYGPVRLSGDAATGYTVPDGDVQVLGLADILASVGGRVDFLKVDVEGAEYPFFLSASDDDMLHVNVLRAEWHGHATADAIDGEGPIGALVQKLLRTHAVSLFGRPADGGIVLAHAYEWPSE